MSKIPRLGHVAVQVDDPEGTARFYADLFGFQVVGRSTSPVTGDMVLLTADRGEEDHLLQLVQKPTAQHVAFRVESLADLKSWFGQVKAKQIDVLMTANHGTQVGFFMKDPSGRIVEVYWPTGRTDIQASLSPIELDLPEEEIMAQIDAIKPR